MYKKKKKTETSVAHNVSTISIEIFESWVAAFLYKRKANKAFTYTTNCTCFFLVLFVFFFCGNLRLHITGHICPKENM